jgi:DNA-binding NarL/FixJ family response regulator
MCLRMWIVRIFIASADKTFRLALMMLLESEPGMVVNGMSDRSEGLSILIGASQPEVLLLDYELARGGTNDLLGDLQRQECPIKVIILAIDPLMEESALAAGADVFIRKNAPPDELLPILRKMRLAENHG